MRRLLPLLLALVAGVAAAQRTNNPGEVSGPQQQRNLESEEDWRNRVESAITLPAWPKDADLIEFHVSNATSFRFFIDAASLSVGPDRIVRYTLVARSASGVTNVSYEGMRCDSGTYKVYAYGNDGRWTVREAEWRDIEPKGIARWHFELRSNFFCLNRTGTIFTTKEGLDALRRANGPGVTGRLPY